MEVSEGEEKHRKFKDIESIDKDSCQRGANETLQTGNSIPKLSYFSLGTTEVRRQWSDIFMEVKKTKTKTKTH